MKKLWFGGTIYTMEKENKTVEAVLTQDDRILAVGSVLNLSEQADEKIDLQGTVMYPGFVDSHLHMIFQGEQIVHLDLSKAGSAEEMLQWVKQEAKKTPADKWLFGEGWNEFNFVDQRIPTLEELDTVREQPILLTRNCHLEQL